MARVRARSSRGAAQPPGREAFHVILAGIRTPVEGTMGGSSYEEVPYADHVHQRSHPDRLACLAGLFGLSPAPVTRCRVLETDQQRLALEAHPIQCYSRGVVQLHTWQPAFVGHVSEMPRPVAWPFIRRCTAGPCPRRTTAAWMTPAASCSA